MTNRPAKIGKDHRVIIPAEVFAAAGLKVGDGLRARETNDHLLVLERVVHPIEEIELPVTRSSGARRYVVERVIHPMEEVEIVGLKRGMRLPPRALEAAGLQQGDVLKMSVDPKAPGVINIE